MNEPPDEGRQPTSQFYNVQYGNYRAELYAAVRADIYGEDIGQNSWLTAAEWRTFGALLDLPAQSHLLEVGSGSGGPALAWAHMFGWRITGIDINAEGIANANQLARDQGLEQQVVFQSADGAEPLPFATEGFDGLVCIDAINHLRDRERVLANWARVLRPGGRVLFTDPITITGLLSSEEIALRSSIGYFLYAPPGVDERLLAAAGFSLLYLEDVTENMARLAGRWYEARERRRADLVAVEGEDEFERTQRFCRVAQTIASERRLSRFVYLAQKS